MGRNANYKVIAIWGLLALVAIILIITGTSFAGNSQSSPAFSACGPLAQEAEGANLHGAMQIGETDGRSFIYVPADNQPSLDAPHPDNRADFCVTIAQSGTYAINAVVSADNDKQDSFWVVINGESHLWDFGFGLSLIHI